MAAVLVEPMSELKLAPEAEVPELLSMDFKVAGLTTFTLEMEAGTAVRDIKKLAQEQCNMEPEHMRLIHKDRELKDADIFDAEMAESDAPIQVMFTAKNSALVGGGCRARSGGSSGQPGDALRGQSGVQSANPWSTPVRGLPGSKGLRQSRMSGRRGGMALIRKS